MNFQDSWPSFLLEAGKVNPIAMQKIELIFVSPEALEQTIKTPQALEKITQLTKKSEEKNAALLEETLSARGVYIPLHVLRSGHLENTENELLDGAARLKAVLKIGRKEDIPVVHIAPVKSIEEKFRYYFYAQSKKILESTVTRCLFLAEAQKGGVEISAITSTWLRPMGWAEHKEILVRAIQIAALPWEVLELAHDKKMTMKQCYQWTLVPPQILNEALKWKIQASPSAALFDEIIEMAWDCFRKKSSVGKTFFDDPEYHEIWNENVPSSQKLQRLREWLKKKKYPNWTQIQEKLVKSKKSVEASTGAKIQWDPSLEQGGLQIFLKINKANEFDGCLKRLSSNEVRNHFSKMLELI